MRISAGFMVLAILGTSLALADEPSPTPAPAATPAAAPAVPAAPAASQQPVAHAPVAAAPAAATTAADPSYDDKHFASEGYRIEVHGDTKLYCRKEEVMGSRLGGHTTCSTADQLKANERASQDAVGHIGQTSPGAH